MNNYYLKVINQCQSTNDELMKLGKSGADEGASILSLTQTKGRGRKNNVWISKKGNMFLSTLLKPHVNKKYWNQISLITGLSLTEVLREIGVNNEDIKIKWPNDILIKDKKVSGILVESLKDIVIVGIGLNITCYPNQINRVYKATSLASLKNLKNLNLENLTHLVLKKFYTNYNTWKNYLIHPFIDKINNNLAFMNRKLYFYHNNEKIIGKQLGIDNQGFLKVLSNSQVYTILSSDYNYINYGEKNVSSG